MGRMPKLFIREEERRRLVQNPPRGSWIERKVVNGVEYYYLRWEEGNEKYSVRISKEEAEEIRRQKERGARIPSFEEFMEKVERLAAEGNEDARKLLKRVKKERATIERVLRLLQA